METINLIFVMKKKEIHSIRPNYSEAVMVRQESTFMRQLLMH